MLSLPAIQPDRLNYFAGGAPRIHGFGVDRTVLWSGAVVTLHWTVEGATGVQIVPGPQAPGAPTHELPPTTVPLDPTSGSVSVTGTHAWEGSYVLRASNACTGAQPATAQASLRMVLRRGLALGGGGSRGDFQIGALLTSIARQDRPARRQTSGAQLLDISGRGQVVGWATTKTGTIHADLRTRTG